MDTKTIDNALGVIEKGLKITEKDVPINIDQHGDENALVTTTDKSGDIESDYEYQRKQFYNLVEKGSTAIDGILELAKEGEHPRGYEVAGNLIKQVAEVTEKLGDLQEKMKRLEDVPNTAPKNVTNALFVGSTAELQKMIKDK
jgi:hypothetical protein